MKILGKAVITAFILLIVLLSILWILAKNIQPEAIKQLVNNQISALTHKKSQINGAISWQIFPRPGLKFSQIIIGDEQLKENFALSIDSMLLNLQITPLLKGRFVFSEINSDGLKLFINQDKFPTSPSSQDHMEHHKEYLNQQFAIQRLTVSHGEVTVYSNGGSTVFKNIQAGIEHFNTQKNPFPVQIKARLTQLAPLATAKASINFKGRLTLAPSFLNELQNGMSYSAIEGQLLIQNSLLNQFKIAKLNTTIKTHKNSISLNPFTLSLYGGESVGDVNYSIANQQLSFNQTATHLDGKRLISALTGQQTIDGTLDYSLHATIPLHQTELEQINGKGTLTIKDGQIYNINLNQMISIIKDRLDNLMKGIPAKSPKILNLSGWESAGSGNTPFKLANSHFTIQDKQITSESLLLQTDTLQVSGDATINISNRALNAKLKVTINDSNDQAIKKIQHALGGYFPLDVSGTIEHPMVLPDITKINPLLGQLLIKNTLEHPLKGVEGTLKELIK
ncbi:AsmA family protein [Legionella worsleiensis]|uniref:Putative asmA protein n=1 Tax=Legionella worsleiensis TaxID=45076 RepID=A0A0W1A3Y0_9GAMM|nr:AsmA family protein [Legionella worsleiensis]KTD76020.1 putative asmA protein [Legionella worsleiensis]STY33034.1 putative asmA protein [Legionella worsleiensis]